MIHNYILRPTTVQAIELNNTNMDEVLTFADNEISYDGNCWKFLSGQISEAKFKNGDYIYKNNNGQLFMIHKKDFEQTFIEDRSMF